MRLPVFACWLILRSKWPAPVLNADEEILLVSAESARVRVDIRDSRLRSALGRSIVARRIEGTIAITNDYKRLLIGRLPLIGKPTGNFRSLRRFRLPLEFARPDRGFVHGFDAFVEALGPEPQRMSVNGFTTLKAQCVEANLEADGWSWLDYYRAYIK